MCEECIYGVVTSIQEATALILAASTGHMETAKVLLKYGADINWAPDASVSIFSLLSLQDNTRLTPQTCLPPACGLHYTGMPL